jgi:GNAT superfamily N-acetyltransferase
LSKPRTKTVIRNTQPHDFAGIASLSRQIYPDSPPWSETQLSSHLGVFPEGQFVAIETETGRIVGMAASLIILWDDYGAKMTWRDFTDNGMFTNHDPEHGRTLYGAEVMVLPMMQRSGIGRRLYQARRSLVEGLGLLRIRAGARLRGYHRYARKIDAEEYVVRVVRGEIKDPTLSFQLRHGFQVLAVVSGYLQHDPESLGYAAVIEWINSRVAGPEDYAGRNARFLRSYGSDAGGSGPSGEGS